MKIQLSIEQIRQKLVDKRLSVVARRVGLSYPTVLSIYSGDNKNPKNETLKKLSDYLLTL